MATRLIHIINIFFISLLLFQNTIAKADSTVAEQLVKKKAIVAVYKDTPLFLFIVTGKGIVQDDLAALLMGKTHQKRLKIRDPSLHIAKVIAKVLEATKKIDTQKVVLLAKEKDPDEEEDFPDNQYISPENLANNGIIILVDSKKWGSFSSFSTTDYRGIVRIISAKTKKDLFRTKCNVSADTHSIGFGQLFAFSAFEYKNRLRKTADKCAANVISSLLGITQSDALTKIKPYSDALFEQSIPQVRSIRAGLKNTVLLIISSQTGYSEGKFTLNRRGLSKVLSSRIGAILRKAGNIHTINFTERWTPTFGAWYERPQWGNSLCLYFGNIKGAMFYSVGPAEDDSSSNYPVHISYYACKSKQLSTFTSSLEVKLRDKRPFEFSLETSLKKLIGEFRQ